LNPEHPKRPFQGHFSPSLNDSIPWSHFLDSRGRFSHSYSSELPVSSDERREAYLQTPVLSKVEKTGSVSSEAHGTFFSLRTASNLRHSPWKPETTLQLNRRPRFLHTTGVTITCLLAPPKKAPKDNILKISVPTPSQER